MSGGYDQVVTVTPFSTSVTTTYDVNAFGDAGPLVAARGIMIGKDYADRDTWYRFRVTEINVAITEFADDDPIINVSILARRVKADGTADGRYGYAINIANTEIRSI